jgi:hypothetical protein
MLLTQKPCKVVPPSTGFNPLETSQIGAARHLEVPGNTGVLINENVGRPELITTHDRVERDFPVPDGNVHVVFGDSKHTPLVEGVSPGNTFGRGDEDNPHCSTVRIIDNDNSLSM